MQSDSEAVRLFPPRARAALRALCGTWYAEIDELAGAPGAERVGSSVERWLARHATPGEVRQVRWLLGALHTIGFPRRSRAMRIRLLLLLDTIPRLRTGLENLRGLVAIHYLGSTDNGEAAWRRIGYPGAPRVTGARSTLQVPVFRPAGDELAADVCIVGSGAGGSVIAAELARAGRDVIVLESGCAFADADLPTDDAGGMSALYWRGGPAPTLGGGVTMLAGATLGGGTTVNWMNCVLPPAQVRESWAREFGIDGIDGSEFDADMQYVLQRISANDRCSAPNGPNRHLAEGAQRLGWSHRIALRNVDAARYSDETGGAVGYGDRSGAKQGAVPTFLADAAACGARIVTGCHAQRIIMRAGRAAGVTATLRDADRMRTVHIRAATVVVACGALETPALLLRSGIGGAHAGRNLHLHPVLALAAAYPEPVQPWIGAPQTVVVDEFAEVEEGYGFLVECPHFSTGVFAASTPWSGTDADRENIADLPRVSAFIAVVRDRGSGRVTIGRDGRARVHYAVTDALDRRNLQRAGECMRRLHTAAGASRMLPLGTGKLFSAHQMGTARMGVDARSSVAAPSGELHGARGVWIGDTSAFPSAVGSNPMVTCQALARRTARRILLFAGLALGAVTPAGAQLRPLDPVAWEMLEPGRRTEAMLGAALLGGQRASLAGTEGRLLEAGTFAWLLRFDRVVLEASGTLYRRLDDEVVFAQPAAETHAPDGDGRSDTGDYRVSTILRLNSLDSPTIAMLRFGTRLPTTNNRTGLERDQTDFFALFGVARTFTMLRVGAEAGLGIIGTRDPTYEQSDVAVYALSAEYGPRAVRATASFVGQFDGLKNGSARGAEDLKELRAGVRAQRGPWWAQVQGIKGFETYSPDYGITLTLGWIR